MNYLKRNLFLFLTLSILAFTTSCSSDDDDNKQTPDINKIDLKSILNSKWNVVDNADFNSIEFNSSGNYILVGDLDKIARSTSDDYNVGNYTITNETDNIVELKEAKMKMKIISQQNDAIEFTLTLLDSAKEYTYKATKNKEMASTTRTDLLCKTWGLVKFETSGEDSEEEEEYYTGMTILFSKAGTYLVDYPNDDRPELDRVGGLASWRWTAGSNETKIDYTWDDFANEGKPEFEDGSGFITITELSANTLIITEIDEEDGTIDKFIFKPYSSFEVAVTTKTKKVLSKTSTRKTSTRFSGKR